MANDWIKLRVWLHRDPKLISMADFLSVEEPFLRWLAGPPLHDGCPVTRDALRHVTRSLCVTVWGVARERGKRDGDDLVLRHCDLSTLDQIAEAPSFGAAMAFVGWAIVEQPEDCPWSVRFPNFFAEDKLPHERHKEKGAERSRRHRKKKRDARDVAGDVTPSRHSNVTVTPREEKSREEKTPKNKTPLFVPPSVEQVATYCRERGNRIDPEAFVSHYQSNGWKVGRTSMKCWKAAVRTWEKNEGKFDAGRGGAPDLFRGAREFMEGGPL